MYIGPTYVTETWVMKTIIMMIINSLRMYSLSFSVRIGELEDIVNEVEVPAEEDGDNVEQ